MNIFTTPFICAAISILCASFVFLMIFRDIRREKVQASKLEKVDNFLKQIYIDTYRTFPPITYCADTTDKILLEYCLNKKYITIIPSRVSKNKKFLQEMTITLTATGYEYVKNNLLSLNT